MGGQNSKSRSRESALSREQTKILQRRESEYMAYYQPILRQELKGTAEGGPVQTRLHDHAVGAVNQQYQQAKGNLVRSLDQREVEGGFRGSALAGLEVARANASSDASTNAYMQAKQQRTGLLGMSMGMAPRPVQSAQFHQDSASTPGSILKAITVPGAV